MCGIAGIAGRPAPEALERMLCATRHRGPDDSGIYLDDTVSLGMNRLSILDLSAAGHQPMLSPDGQLVLVYNGEMYNFREERTRLESLGHSFRSNTDSEVVLALFRQYGKACLDHMRGMFAFAIWDKQNRELFAARDHLGIKPFLYSLQDSQLVFCSELKGMMAHGGIPKTLDRESLAEYFVTGHINQPRTIFSRVKALVPGHFLLWKENGPCIEHCYWSVSQPGPPRSESYEEIIAGTRDLVLQSVAEELVSDVPLGVFLSGGIDSSVVVAAMQAAGASRIQTYSIGFGGEHDALDESSDALQSARFFGTEHHSIAVTSREVEADFENMVRGFDQPVMDAYNTYLVSKHTKTGVTVVLSGVGGDELFGGYHYYRTLLRRHLVPRKAFRLALASRPLWEHLPLPGARLTQLHETAARATIPGHYSLMQRIFTPAEVEALLHRGKGSPTQGSIFRDLIRANAALDDAALSDPFQRISLIGMRSFMAHRLLRDSDAVSMIHSLEIRVPLIDKRLVEYIFPLPWDTKFNKDVVLNSEATSRVYRDTGVKRILVDAFADLLPPGITSRAKRGFTMPVKTWLENAFGERIRSTFGAGNGGYFHAGALDRVHRTWQEQRSNSLRIWAILVLVEWLRQMDIPSLEDSE